ncbi:lipoprotein intramolecular transacylase Lit [Cellvibrio mixtus]|uniref:lipoprotein intramolecular transacylase Lit n=1 Tax=Cellvibrio mixtus TaxID=39650 RepID=UPI0006935096|nr:DUF1461 domain-containing protein [Cellvibrio mixtus]
MKRSLSIVFWPVFFSCQLIALALVSWHLLAQFHFAYPLGYQLLGLDKHIAEYAPLNRNKADFEYTTPADHWRLFGEITDAVQDSGRGLQNISYPLPNGQTTGLMHEAEIIHLQDVANLIDRFYQAGLIGAAIWLILIAIAVLKKWPPPSYKKVLTGFIAGIALITAAVLAIGPTDVFYWLHVQIFPAGHQWFFYYQDSLMTTLMKAPDIFAFIAVFLLVILITLWVIAFLLFKQTINHRLKNKI